MNRVDAIQAISRARKAAQEYRDACCDVAAYYATERHAPGIGLWADRATEAEQTLKSLETDIP